MLIVICGLPVTGKSTLAKHLSKDFEGKILRTDIIRKNLFAESTLEEVLHSDNPIKYNLEQIFDEECKPPLKIQKMIWKQKQMVYKNLLSQLESSLRNNETVILDGTFYKDLLREEVYSIARKTGTSTVLIECHCTEDVVKERLKRRKLIPDDASNVDKIRIYRKVKKVYEHPSTSTIPFIKFDTGKQTTEIQNDDANLIKVKNSIRKLIEKIISTS